MMKEIKLFFMFCLGLLFLQSCVKEEVKPKEIDNVPVESRKIEPPCEQTTVPFEDLATFGTGFGPNWYAGELDRLIRFCELGLTKACQDFSGFEYEEYCCVITEDYDVNNNGLYEPSEQDAIIDFILQEVATYQPSCANAKLVAVDVFRHVIFQDNLGFEAKFMCCGQASYD